MKPKPQKYILSRKFIGGILEGIVHHEITTVCMPVGFVCEKPIGGSPYEIVGCVPVNREEEPK